MNTNEFYVDANGSSSWKLPIQSKDVDEDIVTGTRVEAASDKGIDYDKLIDKFGCFKLTPEHLQKIEKLTKEKPHRLLRRGMFFCHRDMDLILDSYEKMEPFYLYTGRGPSGEALHLGHTIPFVFT
jgi:tryptophanyl-tRNA synthetase